MLKAVAFLITTIIGFAAYTLVFAMALGLEPHNTVSLLMTGELEYNPLEEYKKTIAAADSINAEITGLYSAQEDSLKQELANIRTEKAELDQQKLELAQMMETWEKSSSDRLYKLAKIYNDMDPTQLASVINDMDDTLVIAILPKMKNQQASRILEMLPPDRSARISSKLLGKK